MIDFFSLGINVAIKFTYMNGEPTTCFIRVRAFAVHTFWSNSLILLLNDVATSFPFHLLWCQHKRSHLVQFILHFLYLHTNQHAKVAVPYHLLCVCVFLTRVCFVFELVLVVTLHADFLLHFQLRLNLFLSASNISVVKQAEALLDPDLFNMLRFTIAAIPFVPLLLKSLRDMQIFFRGLELGIWVSLAYLAQAMGLVTADAGRASFISALTVRTLFKNSTTMPSLKRMNMITSLFFIQIVAGDHCPFLGWSYWSRSTCSYMVWSIFITSWCCYTGAKWFSAMCKSDYLHGQVNMFVWTFCLLVLWPMTLCSVKVTVVFKVLTH